VEVIVLAGGRGTRLKEYFDGPKPLCPVNNRPFLHYVLQYWASQGASKFIICGGPDWKLFKDHFTDKYMGVPIDYVSEETRVGTGGAMLKGAELLKSPYPFMVINGDTLFKVPFLFLWKLQEQNNGITMTLNHELQNGGVYLFEQSIGRAFEGTMNPCSLELQILSGTERAGLNVIAYLFNETFIQINEPEDVEKAKVLLL